MRLSLLLFSLLLLMNSRANTLGASNHLVVRDVSVITMLDEKVMEHQDVAIENGMIVGIAPTTQSSPNSLETTVVDGKGKFIIPGLIDSHAHITFMRDQSFAEDELFLYLSQGVTALRDMRGSQFHKKLKLKLDSKEILGPRYFLASPSMAGNPFPKEFEGLPDDQGFVCFEHSCRVRSSKGGKEAVEWVSRSGYQFYKVYSFVDKEPMMGVIKTARALDLDLVGHVPSSLSLKEVLEKNYFRSIEHVGPFGRYAESKASPLWGLGDRNPLAEDLVFGEFGARLYYADQEKLKEIVEIAGASYRGYIVPTLKVFEAIFKGMKDGGLLSAPGMEYMDQCWKDKVLYWRKWYQEAYKKSVFKGDPSLLDYFIQSNLELIHKLNQAKAKIVAGTDGNAAEVISGFGLHEEIKALKKAGLSNYEALRSATLYPSQMLRENRIGSVRVGNFADLVILEGNPLTDIESISQIHAVIFNGEFFSESQLSNTLGEIKNRAEGFKCN